MPADVKNLKSLIEKEALSRMDFTEELSEEEIYSRIDDALLSHNERKKLSTDEMLRLREEVFYALKKMDILQEFIDDASDCPIQSYD